MTITRYSPSDTGTMWEHPEGPYVTFEDYASLAAEAQRLKNQFNELYNSNVAIIDENVRLREIAKNLANQLELVLHYIANPEVEGQRVVALPSAEIVLARYKEVTNTPPQ